MKEMIIAVAVCSFSDKIIRDEMDGFLSKKEKKCSSKNIFILGSRQKWVPLDIEPPKGHRGRRSRSAGRRNSPPPNRRDPKRIGGDRSQHGGTKSFFFFFKTNYKPLVMICLSLLFLNFLF